MKRLILVSVIAAVAACSPANEADAVDEATEVAAEEPAAVVAADGQPTPGMYKVTTEEGVFMEDVKADGTYVTTDADGKVIETGMWEQRTPEQYCSVADEQFREEGETGEMKCNTEGIGEDGVWTSVNAEGQTATVERVAE